MKVRKRHEWEDHHRVPGGDEMFLLEAVEVPENQPRYAQVSWSILNDAEFEALEREEVIDLDPKRLGELLFLYW